MNEITIFKNERFGEVRTATSESGEPLFAALDLGSVYCKSKVILFLFFVCLISNIKVYGTVYFFISQSKLQHLFNVIYIVES